MDFLIRLFRQFSRLSVSVITLLFLLFVFGIIFFIGVNNTNKAIASTLRINSNENNIYSYNYHKDYEFVKNITQYPFFGAWTQLNFIKNNFVSKLGGEAEFLVSQKPKQNYISTIEDSNSSSLMISYLMKDGEYIDYFFRGNFSFALPTNFSVILKEAIDKRKNITIELKNISMGYFSGEYLDDFTDQSYNMTDINVTFGIKEKLFISKDAYTSASNLFSKIYLSIDSPKNRFSAQLYGEMYGGSGYPSRILNYSIILTMIALIQIYFSIKLLVNVSENNQLGLNVDIFTISIQIMWDCLICAVHFFLAITNDQLTYEYGMPSMTYFFLFSIFQLRILFLSWKSRYQEIMYNDINLFRRKLFKFYSLFYCILFVTLISIRFWYDNFYITYSLFFFGTWFFQIYHSATTGTKPPMSYSYIFIFSLCKMFIPLYIKGCPYNLFEFRPAYGKVSLISVTIIVEAIILSLQKLIGPKIVIPRFLREQAFEYYIGINEIPNTQEECIICLEKLCNRSSSEEIKENDEANKNSDDYYKKLIDFVDKLKEHRSKNDYMRTPCHHIFHSKCLEKWLELKNECPYCRSKIPPLDDL